MSLKKAKLLSDKLHEEALVTAAASIPGPPGVMKSILSPDDLPPVKELLEKATQGRMPAHIAHIHE